MPPVEFEPTLSAAEQQQP
jgi:hypothetical protein